MKISEGKYKFLDEDTPCHLSSAQLAVRDELNEKIKNQELSFESVPCLCGNDDYDVIASIERHGLNQQTVICTNCGLIRSNPRLTAEGYRTFYETDTYRLLYEGENTRDRAIKRFDDAEYKESDRILERVKRVKEVDASTKILDFGSGAGHHLRPFLRAGASCTGVDYSKESVNIGRQHGLDMVQGGLDQVEGEFDVILMCHVLEHLLDPIVALRKIGSHLANSGVLYISMPNIEHMSLLQIQNAHTYYFSPDTFKYYGESAGLENIDLGVSDVIHVYGTFRVGRVLRDGKGLDASKKRMYGVVRRYERMWKLKSFLKKVGLFDVAKLARQKAAKCFTAVVGR